ncbi:MAG TPA: hypothetical protein VMH87_18255, partial [Pseudomonadales bacterium]|nr:hypothetical protein [Pseudomonadales bacterium]
VDIWVKVGYSLQINSCFIYYTTDGSNPDGGFGIGKGTTQVVPAFFVSRDSVTNNIDWWKGTIPAQPNGTQVRYKVALFDGGSYGMSAGDTTDWPSIAPVTNTDITGSKLFGLTQATITNFNPTTAVVWYHNDLNPANTYTGLQTGYHIIRARTFLSRPGQSSVYNTFAQTFYYDGSLPSGVITSPAGGTTISNSTYTIVIRGDSSVTEADVNIQDGATNTYDIYTGQANGIGTNSSGQPIFVAAQSVTPNPTLSAQYPNYSQEFHLNFPFVPTGGVVNITVHLKELTSSLYANRFTTLNVSFNAQAPTQYVTISNPSQDGQVVTLPNGAPFTIQACFTTNLLNNPSNFWIFINGAFQPRGQNNSLYTIGGSGCGPGMQMISYNWQNPVIGTNSIEVLYSNTTATVISDMKSVIIARSLQITSLTGNNQLNWSSAPGLNYEVLATTNLNDPFEPISGVIPSQGTSTSYTDQTYTNTIPQKFYEIELLSSP